MTITLPRNQLASFRAKALQCYPGEYGVLLYGRVGRDGAAVRLLKNVSHLRSPEHFWYDPDLVPKKIGRSILLGLLHTHPGSDSAPGDDDWVMALDRHFILHGICRVDPTEKPKTRLAFYLGVGGMLRIKII